MWVGMYVDSKEGKKKRKQKTIKCRQKEKLKIHGRNETE